MKRHVVIHRLHCLIKYTSQCLFVSLTLADQETTKGAPYCRWWNRIDWRRRHSETISDGKHPAGRSDGNQTAAAHPAWQALLFRKASIQTHTTYASPHYRHFVHTRISFIYLGLYWFCILLFDKWLLLHRSKFRSWNARFPSSISGEFIKCAKLP